MPPSRIAITPGEPAGIGPDIVVQLAQRGCSNELVVVADPDLMAQRAKQLGLNLKLHEFKATSTPEVLPPGELFICPTPMVSPCKPGQLNVDNAQYVLDTLNTAVEGCLNGTFDGLTTGPVQKSIINDAGTEFTGHTEFLADLCQCNVVMMLATEELRVALATTHLPLRDVADAIDAPLLEQVITILYRDLQEKFAIPTPRILIAGLNPHAGEAGHLGREEQQILIPVIDSFRNRGWDLVGPLPADTLFTEKYLRDADAVLAMYHDQGLPVLKYQGFGKAINVTLGLPIVRTSVDHGTALDLAGSGESDFSSLQLAVDYAARLASATVPTMAQEHS